MIRARVTTLFVFLAVPLGTESTAWADDTEPPTLTPEQLVALCEVLDDEIATFRIDPGTLERYRTQCAELDSPAAPGVPSTPIDSGQPPPAAPEPPTDPTPEQPPETSVPPPAPPQARTSESTVAAPASEPDPGGPAPAAPTELVQRQTDTAENDSEAPVAGAFDLPTFDYADLLLTPEATPVFESTASYADEAHSPGQDDLAAAGSAISLATEQDRLPRSTLFATVLISLTGVALLRSYLARRN